MKNYEIEDIMYEVYGTDEFNRTSNFCIHDKEKIREYYHRYIKRKKNKLSSQPYMKQIIKRIHIDAYNCQLDFFDLLDISIKDIMYEVYSVNDDGLCGVFKTYSKKVVTEYFYNYTIGKISSYPYMIQIVKRIPIDFDSCQLDFFDLL